MILTEEEIKSCFEQIFGEGEYGMTGDLSIARAIEQAILDKLQDKLKNAERYEWIRNKVAVINSGHYICIKTTSGSIDYYDREETDIAIDSAIVKERN